MERKWNYKEIINGKEGWNEKMVKKKMAQRENKDQFIDLSVII